jgi:hypothetical protein
LKGNRLTYQQNPGNHIEALREVQLDIEQGADIVMVKPGMPYLDILRDIAATVTVPVASYVVSGEYAMIEFAAQAGVIDRKSAILETLLGVKRAGAGIIANYWALEVAGWLESFEELPETSHATSSSTAARAATVSRFFLLLVKFDTSALFLLKAIFRSIAYPSNVTSGHAFAARGCCYHYSNLDFAVWFLLAAEL